jgi:hypothetical protein
VFVGGSRHSRRFYPDIRPATIAALPFVMPGQTWNREQRPADGAASAVMKK